MFNGYGSTEAGIVSGGVCGENLGLISCRTKVKVLNWKAIYILFGKLNFQYNSTLIVKTNVFHWFQIVNVDTGGICKPGELGEICISSPFMMMEYLERPEANKEVFLGDGFLRTGDLAVYDDSVFLYWSD